MNNIKKYFIVILLYSTSFLGPVTTLFYLHRGLTYSNIFMLLLAVVIAMFVSEIPTGIFGDKFGKKTSIVTGLFLLVIFNVMILFANSFIFFLAASVLMGIAITFMSGSDEALIYESLKDEKKQHMMKAEMSRINSASFIPKIITAPIGAFLAQNLTESQFRLLIILGIAFSFAAFSVGLTLKEPSSSGKGKKNRSSIELFTTSFSDIKKSPTIVRLFINKTLVLIVCSHVFGVIWQPYLQESGVPIVAFGIFIAASAGIIAYLNNRITDIEKFISSKSLLYITALLSFIAFLLGAFIKNMYYAIAFYFIIRIMLWIRYPVFSHYINHHVKSRNRATVLSALSMVDSAFDIIIFISASIISGIGFQYIFIFSAAIIGVALVFFRIKDEHMVERSVTQKRRT